MIVFLIPTTLVFHDFWTYEGEQLQKQMIQFLKNLAIMGGLYLVHAIGGRPACAVGGRLMPSDDERKAAM